MAEKPNYNRYIEILKDGQKKLIEKLDENELYIQLNNNKKVEIRFIWERLFYDCIYGGKNLENDKKRNS